MANRPQVQTVGSAADKAKLFFAVFLAAAGFAVYFVLNKRQDVDGWIQLAILVVSWLLAAGVFLWSSQGKQFIAYCKDSVKEVKKVVWPTRKEAMQMTLYVFIFVLIMATVLWFIDWGLYKVIYGWLLGWGS